ncbi:MAG: hypothetical protein HZB30_12650 [Nitrospirae bacterium]|nr:hypothetical protein [Nitrospirota bacterium]
MMVYFQGVSLKQLSQKKFNPATGKVRKSKSADVRAAMCGYIALGEGRSGRVLENSKDIAQTYTEGFF